LGATARRTVSAPLPLSGLGVAHGASVLAVHEQAAFVLTSMASVPPSAPITLVFGETTNEQGAASWERSRDLSLTTTVPLRATGSGFSATRNDTLPSPWPDVGGLIVIQLACVEAVHGHSRGAPTVAVPLPPVGPKTAVDVDRVDWHRSTTLGLVTLDTLELPHPTKVQETPNKMTTAGERGAIAAGRCTTATNVPRFTTSAASREFGRRRPSFDTTVTDEGLVLTRHARHL
jgi:hypothetical protein